MTQDAVPQPEGEATPAMPEGVRTRVLALAADVLPLLADVPPALRKVASFAPNRRARLGGTQIAAALESDDDFRSHVATQVSARETLAEAVVAGEPPTTADPVEVAAIAWLTRPDGWQETFAAAVRRVEQAAVPVDSAELDRLRDKLDQARRATKDLRAEHKAQVEELKAENTSLRRKLGESRAALREATEGQARAGAETQQARELAETALTNAEAENRRLRGQVEEAQAALAAARREVRSGRDQATLRARLLLDTLLDAGQGLRRELALPAVEGAPADGLEAELAAADERDPGGVTGRSGPALLEHYLSLPRARLLIDGYNVTKTAWPQSSLEAQRVRLLGSLATLVSRTGAETTVVFDAANATSRPPMSPPRGVRALFSPAGVIADDVIRDLVAEEPTGRVVVVVTSDQALADDVRRAGARPVSSISLLGLL